MDRSRAATREVYDEIAAHFAATRTHPWPEVTEFLETAPRGQVGLDVGCGNGRHLPALAERVERSIGLDLSTELLAIASDRAVDAELLVGDAVTLPLAADSVAVGLSIATLHHLPTRALRVRSLDEFARVLAPGGRALVSAWSTEHDRFDDRAPAGPAEDASEGDTGDRTGFDTALEWELPDGEAVDRFYHVYDPAEFDADLGRSDLRIIDSEVSSGNCYATVAAPE